MDDLVDAVRESLARHTREEFERRVAEQASAMASDIDAGALDTHEFAVGMELEAYVVDDRGRPTPVPEAVYDLDGCDEELGVHNLEIHTPPDALDGAGLDRQAATICETVEAVREVLAEHDRHLVLDGSWAVPPAGGTERYLGAVEDHAGVVVATNMRSDPRYVALDNAILERAGGAISLSVPGVSVTFPSILVESLATSIQPHLQVPDAASFPDHFDVALRTTGPVLALTANSPFLPADLYETSSDGPGADEPVDLVDATHDELRIQVFEQSINAGLALDDRKVRFPRDIETASEVVDRLVDDQTDAPFLFDEDWQEATYDERYPELAHKHGTYWRWVRPVVGGQSPRGSDGTEASLRIEYRPLPTQPTSRDVVACQALVCGLVRGLVAADHPLADLPWDAARDGFYAAAEEGLDADLAWITADSTRTTDSETIFEEVFEYARRGLVESGVTDERVDDLLDPLEARWEARTSPSRWKKARVRDALAAGKSFDEALEAMQRAYLERSRETASFAEWL